MKKDLAIAIAKALKRIHDLPKTEVRDSELKYYAHKHLSSHNIFISGNI